MQADTEGGALMSTVDRCTCPKTGPSSLLVQVGAVKPGLTYAIERKCPVHGDIDEILESGRYTDRRGRKWKNVTHLNVESWAAEPYGRPDILPAQMRLMIERDQHRGECRGLDSCTSHPVPHVLAGRAFWGRFYVYEGGPRGIRSTLAEAMDAARALAVNP